MFVPSFTERRLWCCNLILNSSTPTLNEATSLYLEKQPSWLHER
jgi:hypothetical protein